MMMLPRPAVPKVTSHCVLMGFTSNAKGLLRAAVETALIQDMTLQSPIQRHRFSQCPCRGEAEAMWFGVVWVS